MGIMRKARKGLENSSCVLFSFFTKSVEDRNQAESVRYCLAREEEKIDKDGPRTLGWDEAVHPL